jgi:hypothetical protein
VPTARTAIRNGEVSPQVVRKPCRLAPTCRLRLTYDEHYKYAFRTDADRATPKTQQYSEDYGSPARSLSEVRQPERKDNRPFGVLSDSLFPV